MEPVLGGRDDRHPPASPVRPVPRRNGARPWRTGRRQQLLDLRVQVEQPQWSPSLADGTTGARDRAIGPGHPAAMEPVLGGRDDAPAGPVTARRRRPRRNGARPWRTGRPPPVLSTRHASVMPQWSPSLADGTTADVLRSGRLGHELGHAAMEPVLGGRDDPLTRPPTGEPSGRNGARPWRTGRPAARDLLPAREFRRNGARPWRTGRLVVTCGKCGTDFTPQWSPSLADGTTCSGMVGLLGLALPQWSPSLADGTTPRLRHALSVAAGAAMEPVLGGRDDCAPEPLDHRRSTCRNGARPWRTGRRLAKNEPTDLQ